MESPTNDLVVLLQGLLPDLKRTRELLESRGVAAEILRPSSCQTSSWKPTFWLAVASQDVPRGQIVLREAQLAGLSAAERAAADAVIDLDAAEIACPACGHVFPTGPEECPDCGLYLGG